MHRNFDFDLVGGSERLSSNMQDGGVEDKFFAVSKVNFSLDINIRMYYVYVA